MYIHCPNTPWMLATSHLIKSTMPTHGSCVCVGVQQHEWHSHRHLWTRFNTCSISGWPLKVLSHSGDIFAVHHDTVSVFSECTIVCSQCVMACRWMQPGQAVLPSFSTNTWGWPSVDVVLCFFFQPLKHFFFFARFATNCDTREGTPGKVLKCYWVKVLCVAYFVALYSVRQASAETRYLRNSACISSYKLHLHLFFLAT